MFSHLERPAQRAPGLRQVLADAGPRYIANGFIGWVFSATAPVAIILAVGSGGGLSEAELASWLFGVFFVNGLTTLLFSWLYRAPLGFAWTIPGTVLVGPALAHLRFAEVVGAFYATGLLMLVLGATGWVKRAMQAVPMPLVMGMVAGVFLRFGLDLVRALHADAGIAAPMVGVWLLLTAVPALGRRVPPMIGAAKELSSQSVPMLGWATPRRAVSMMPASAARRPLSMWTRMRVRATGTPASSAARGLAPSASI